MPIRWDRRDFIRGVATTVGGSCLIASGGEDPSKAADPRPLAWHDVQEWGIEGKGWEATETERYFDRLPLRARGVVRNAVWNLSRHSAGMLARFRTDAEEIWVDYTVTSTNLAMPHMPATGVSGVDLYAADGAGNPRWLSVSRPTQRHTRAKLISGLAPGERDYTLYLPLYNGTESLQVGVPEGAHFAGIEPRPDKPIVFYGTSITHGACASRPGMPHPAILGRRLNRPVINLGFSGNGKMEGEVAELLSELDPAVFVIDCLPNMVGREVAERAVPLVQRLRRARPQTPIVLVEDRTYANTPFLPAKGVRHRESRAALKAAFEELMAAGESRLSYVDGETLLGQDRDDTTDGSHPSDLGFYRQADALQPHLERWLGG